MDVLVNSYYLLSDPENVNNVQNQIWVNMCIYQYSRLSTHYFSTAIRAVISVAPSCVYPVKI